MKVTCTSPNASEEINGVPFERQENGSVVAAGLGKDVAAQFEGIPGYTVEDDGKEPKAPKAPKEIKDAPAA
ncbi:hypothetical protein [Propionivibrio sp.]|uniref:hypothetical protein n=1 Tax=Propionivibrio sp. TaxID=2212460 RepID=UPI003BF382EF